MIVYNLHGRWVECRRRRRVVQPGGEHHRRDPRLAAVVEAEREPCAALRVFFEILADAVDLGLFAPRRAADEVHVVGVDDDLVFPRPTAVALDAVDQPAALVQCLVERIGRIGPHDHLVAPDGRRRVAQR